MVLGFVLGGVGPRTQLTEQDDELSRLRDELVEARSRAARRSPLSVVGLDRMGASAPQSAPPATAPGTASSFDEDPSQVVVEEWEPSPDDVAPQGSPEDLIAEFDAAVEAQRIRREQTRAALVEQADLRQEEVEELDAVVDRMNDRLGELGTDLMDIALSGEEPDSTEMLALTHEVSGILYDAQVEVDAVVGEEVIDEVDPSAREVWNYVDLETFRDTVEAAGDVDWGTD